MSRSRADLRPSITKLTVKGTLPSISLEKERAFADSIKGQGLELATSQSSGSANRRKQQDRKENLDYLLKEIEKWRGKYTNSQRSLEEARTEIKFKTDKIHNLELKIEGLENDFKRDLLTAKEKLGNHNKCKKEVESLRETLNQKEVQLTDITNEMVDVRKALQYKIEAVLREKQEEHDRYELRLTEERESMTKEFDLKFNSLKEEYEKQINAKDEKLKIMKKQIAEALTGSSLERQQQIEELLKELKRVSDEADAVKSALKSIKMKGNCGKCAVYEKKCRELQEQLKSKDASFNELMRISSKMEKQISQQEELFAIWNKLKHENKISPR